jgi:hypothetical protein
VEGTCSSLDTEKLQYFCVEGTYSSLGTEKPPEVFSAIRTFAQKNRRRSVFSLRQAPVALGKSNKRLSWYRIYFLM